MVEEETDLPKRSISGIGYEAYGDSAHIEYFSATHNKWLLGKHGVRCQMILPASRSSLGMFGMRPMRFPTMALPERLQGCIQGTGSLVEDTCIHDRALWRGPQAGARLCGLVCN